MLNNHPIIYLVAIPMASGIGAALLGFGGGFVLLAVLEKLKIFQPKSSDIGHSAPHYSKVLMSSALVAWLACAGLFGYHVGWQAAASIVIGDALLYKLIRYFNLF